ncbi:Aste57867_3170 [Aphanomyces stellatus]|uniref:Aste57867_3170 protein n=1 Tax=Aphanomyces stellatus TaxID=120398 RepID=A0A485KED9_9STRA|nr:hypothetical protein As57867_003161 [Aphanomyces stellatus]VFT80344.1 Aste57867_3170 [Aphanomyces stellatus]
MEIAVVASIEQYGTVHDLMQLENVCHEWRRWCSNRRPWQVRFRREFPDEYAFLAGETEDIASAQEWRLLFIQQSTSFASGFLLGSALPQQHRETAADDAAGEASLRRWVFVTRQAINSMSRTMSDVLAHTTPELLPLEEAKYWQRAVDQSKALQDMESLGGRGELGAKLQEQVLTIKKLHHQAQWNAKYFKVLEKPFQELLVSDMKQITYIVPAMIKTLKMMWSSSKYYKDCFKMGGLLSRIATALCARVCASISITSLLQGDDFQATIDVVESAGTMLARWHDVYDTTSTTWGPFDVFTLFHRVDYVAQRCSECRSALVLLRQIRVDMVRVPILPHDPDLIEIDRVQDHPDQIDAFEGMLAAMDRDLHTHLAGVNMFEEEHAGRWRAGLDVLRRHSDDLLRFVHGLA